MSMELQGTRAIEFLSKATSTGPLSYTATTIRPTSRSIPICSHHMVIITKEKAEQEHTQKFQG